ncbi:MAG: GTPase [Acutalibacteraceae bacterium]
MKFEDAFFEFAAGKLNQLPPSDVPEIVFSGKSNVGKSSLINKILNRKSLARVSATPERREPCFYSLKECRLVDLPATVMQKSSTRKNYAGLNW